MKNKKKSLIPSMKLKFVHDVLIDKSKDARAHNLLVASFSFAPTVTLPFCSSCPCLSSHHEDIVTHKMHTILRLIASQGVTTMSERKQQQCSNLPKLTYFDLAGRAFGLRIALFKAFGKDGWVVDRIEFETWPSLKPKTPLGSLPILTLPNSSVRAQTDALTRWAGKKAGLYPNDEDDALIVDEVITTSFEAFNKTPQASNDEEKKRLRQEYAEGFLSKALT